MTDRDIYVFFWRGPRVVVGSSSEQLVETSDIRASTRGVNFKCGEIKGIAKCGDLSALPLVQGPQTREGREVRCTYRIGFVKGRGSVASRSKKEPKLCSESFFAGVDRKGDSTHDRRTGPLLRSSKNAWNECRGLTTCLHVQTRMRVWWNLKLGGRTCHH